MLLWFLFAQILFVCVQILSHCKRKGEEKCLEVMNPAQS